jgi:hypothetical protein
MEYDVNFRRGSKPGLGSCRPRQALPGAGRDTDVCGLWPPADGVSLTDHGTMPCVTVQPVRATAVESEAEEIHPSIEAHTQIRPNLQQDQTCMCVQVCAASDKTKD